MTSLSTRLVVATCLLAAVASAQRFDLADAIGRRNGEPPGQGQPFHYPIQRSAFQGLFIPESAVTGIPAPCPFVHGIFIPQDQAVGTSHVADRLGGIAGCNVLGSLDVTTVGNPMNTTALTLAIPNDLNLLGNHMYVQCHVVDPALGAAIPVATSDAADLLFGS